MGVKMGTWPEMSVETLGSEFEAEAEDHNVGHI